MNVVPSNEAEKLRQATLICVGNGLRDYYGDVLKEAIPSGFTDLLQRLVAAAADSKERG